MGLTYSLCGDYTHDLSCVTKKMKMQQRKKRQRKRKMKKKASKLTATVRARDLAFASCVRQS